MEEIQELELEEIDNSVKIMIKGNHPNTKSSGNAISVFKVFEFGTLIFSFL